MAMLVRRRHAISYRSRRPGRSSDRSRCFLMATGAALWFNGCGWASGWCSPGSRVLVYMMFGWFGKVIGE